MSPVVGVPVALSDPGASTRSARDRWFFGGMALAAALAVFLGFAPTYFLKSLHAAPILSPLAHVHGILFTSWILLFFAQTTLIAIHRTDVHRRLGIAAGLLIVAMLFAGTSLAIATARALSLAPPVPGLPSPLPFLVIPLSDLGLFSLLVAAGLYQRRRADAHKRLMLMATISLLNAALVRLALPGHALGFLGLPPGQRTGFALTTLFVMACVLYDVSTRRRVHPAFLWGGLLIVVSHAVRLPIGGTAVWLTFAGWLTR